MQTCEAWHYKRALERRCQSLSQRFEIHIQVKRSWCNLYMHKYVLMKNIQKIQKNASFVNKYKKFSIIHLLTLNLAEINCCKNPQLCDVYYLGQYPNISQSNYLILKMLLSFWGIWHRILTFCLLLYKSHISVVTAL